jgi:NAD-dependent dihydropyrimidine dehydrogenase PreA subunit
MTCTHTNLVLLSKTNDRVRCHHCHLTIGADELRNGYCPECYEVSGQKRYDFEEVHEPSDRDTCYQCEDCGAMIPATRSAS